MAVIDPPVQIQDPEKNNLATQVPQAGNSPKDPPSKSQQSKDNSPISEHMPETTIQLGLDDDQDE